MKLKAMMETIKTKAKEANMDEERLAAFLDGILYGMTAQKKSGTDEDDKKSA